MKNLLENVIRTFLFEAGRGVGKIKRTALSQPEMQKAKASGAVFAYKVITKNTPSEQNRMDLIRGATLASISSGENREAVGARSKYAVAGSGKAYSDYIYVVDPAIGEAGKRQVSLVRIIPFDYDAYDSAILKALKADSGGVTRVDIGQAAMVTLDRYNTMQKELEQAPITAVPVTVGEEPGETDDAESDVENTPADSVILKSPKDSGYPYKWIDSTSNKEYIVYEDVPGSSFVYIKNQDDYYPILKIDFENNYTNAKNIHYNIPPAGDKPKLPLDPNNPKDLEIIKQIETTNKLAATSSNNSSNDVGKVVVDNGSGQVVADNGSGSGSGSEGGIGGDTGTSSDAGDAGDTGVITDPQSSDTLKSGAQVQFKDSPGTKVPVFSYSNKEKKFKQVQSYVIEKNLKNLTFVTLSKDKRYALVKWPNGQQYWVFITRFKQISEMRGDVKQVGPTVRINERMKPGQTFQLPSTKLYVYSDTTKKWYPVGQWNEVTRTTKTIKFIKYSKNSQWTNLSIDNVKYWVPSSLFSAENVYRLNKKTIEAGQRDVEKQNTPVKKGDRIFFAGQPGEVEELYTWDGSKFKKAATYKISKNSNVTFEAQSSKNNYTLASGFFVNGKPRKFYIKTTAFKDSDRLRLSGKQTSLSNNPLKWTSEAVSNGVPVYSNGGKEATGKRITVKATDKITYVSKNNAGTFYQIKHNNATIWVPVRYITKK